jgi:hypothetical protein
MNATESSRVVFTGGSRLCVHSHSHMTITCTPTGNSCCPVHIPTMPTHTWHLDGCLQCRQCRPPALRYSLTGCCHQLLGAALPGVGGGGQVG